MNWPIRIGSIVAVLLLCLGVDQVIRVLLPGIQADYLSRLVIFAALYVTWSVSLNLINGITGQFSIGHMAFAMVGAYSVALLTTAPALAGLPMWVWPLVACVVGAFGGAIAGLIVGLPSLRLRGDYLAIVTLGFGEILMVLVRANDQLLGGGYGINSAFQFRSVFWALALAALTCALSRNLLQTAKGLQFLAVREDEVASLAMGVNVTRTKVSAFVLGAALAGAAGALIPLTEKFVSPGTFTMAQSFLILTMVVLGGTGSISGSAVAAVLLFGIPEILRNAKTPDGQSIGLSGPVTIGLILAAGFAVAATRRAEHIHEDNPRTQKLKRAGLIAGATAVGMAFGMALVGVPQIGQQQFNFDQLRFVIFALTLLVLMLLRPQGMFGHREISLSRFFKKDDAMGVKV